MSIKDKLLVADATANVPLKWVGPIKLLGFIVEEEVHVPLATYETPLWPSVERGARVSGYSGINVEVLDEQMTRSVCVKAKDASHAKQVAREISKEHHTYAELISASSSYAKLKDVQAEVVGRLLYIRFSIFPADASGHNMVTKAAEQCLTAILEKYSDLEYVSLSGNYCTDKKVSAVNGILGRGRSCIAEILVSKKICQKLLRVKPEQIVAINQDKNLLGSILAGSLRSANAHYANILLAAYLATGQDAANIVEGSQGITTAELEGDDLYFSVNLPNIIVGTVGNGKDLDFVSDNLKRLGCAEKRNAGENSRRLAAIIAAAVLCGELSLLAALCNPGELVKTHLKLER